MRWIRVDDFAVAQRLDRARGEMGGSEPLQVLLEVRLGGEESKTGVGEDELNGLADKVVTLNNLRLYGLMCIPPYNENPEATRPYFARLRELREGLEQRLRVKLPSLSMGMSHDFEIAISEGATQIRLGTAVFGVRAAAR